MNERHSSLVMAISTHFSNIHLQDPQQYIDELLGIHRKFSELMKDTFKDDAAFVSALDKVKK